ncbi:hypothetical protein HYE67_000343 [Fusarium culmorum]|uniref:Uncharacterized protein n=1 Tax=Fusarium culmorum TaxID=5516 RepID=A0A2T4GKK0_FUSCU|nr:hypothetical protein FCULG_00001944 [Fusarium culmorum]QPC58112.1 hypothetical protein HYE67_000343 [Fusarium culmorum]
MPRYIHTADSVSQSQYQASTIRDRNQGLITAHLSPRVKRQVGQRGFPLMTMDVPVIILVTRANSS